ncbi:MAG: ABC transporter permease [Cyclobacteriaceae bacterium]
MEVKSNPPKWANKLLKLYCRPDRYEEISGDLEELFDLRIGKGNNAWWTKIRYSFEVIRCCKAYARKSDHNWDTSGALVQSFIKLSWRRMLHNKFSFAINILGLAFALSFCMVTYSFFGYNQEFDQDYTNEHVYRIHVTHDDVYDQTAYELTPLSIGESILRNHAGVDKCTSYLTAGINLGKGKYFFNTQLSFVSPSYLEMFPLDVLKGSAEEFEKNGLYLTRSMADKLFPDSNPVGEVLSLYYFGNKMPDVKVLGVLKDPPANSTFIFEGLLHIDQLVDQFKLDKKGWGSRGFTFGQYIQLQNEDYKEAVEQTLTEKITEYNEVVASRKIKEIRLVPFHDPSLESGNFYSYTNTRKSSTELLMFAAISLLILAIACFNVANTQIGLMVTRTKEIGVRRTIGSQQIMIFLQFIVEMSMIMLFAFVLALSLTNVISAQVWQMYGNPFLINELDLWRLAGFSFLFLVSVSIITGLIPAIYSLKFKPVTIINHRMKFSGLGKTHYALGVMQLTLSVILLVVGASFMKNVSFMANADFGYNPKNLMAIRVSGEEEYNMLHQKFETAPFVEEAFGSSHYLSGYCYRSTLKKEEDEVSVDHYQVGPDYLSKMGVSFLEGRNFNRSMTTDFEKGVIVNEEFARQYMSDKVVGESLLINDKTYHVLGLIKNYQDGELFNGYQNLPLLFTAARPDDYDFIFLRTTGYSQDAAQLAAEAIWFDLFETPFIHHWQDEMAYSGTVETASQMRDMLGVLTLIAFALCLLGIYAMAAIQIGKSRKEISIRKVLGATYNELLGYFNRPFLIMMGLAVTMGLVLGNFLTDEILGSIFSRYTTLSVMTEIGITVGIGVLVIFFIVIAIHKPIKSNPVEGLRTE